MLGQSSGGVRYLEYDYTAEIAPREALLQLLAVKKKNNSSAVRVGANNNINSRNRAYCTCLCGSTTSRSDKILQITRGEIQPQQLNRRQETTVIRTGFDARCGVDVQQ